MIGMSVPHVELTSLRASRPHEVANAEAWVEGQLPPPIAGKSAIHLELAAQYAGLTSRRARARD